MRKIVTDILEIGGLLLLVTAGSVEAWLVAPAVGLAAGGVGLLGASALLVRVAK